MVQHPNYKHHPMHNHPLASGDPDYHKRYGIPLRLHADETCAISIGKQWGKMADALSWTGCLGLADKIPTSFKHLLIFNCLEIVKVGMRFGNMTEKQIWRVVVWSLKALQLGRHPTHDWDNNKFVHGQTFAKQAGHMLADGYFAPVWVIAADLDYMFKKYGCANFNSSSEPCTCCQVNSSTVPWTDVRDKPLWMNYIWTTSGYNLKHPNRHLVFSIPGVTNHTYIPDSMHCKQIGADPMFAGSILRYFTHYFFTDDPLQNLNFVVTELRAIYKDLKAKNCYATLTPNMIHPPSKKYHSSKEPLAKSKASSSRCFCCAGNICPSTSQSMWI